MIALNNINKVYTTKSKRKVFALNNLSLRFPDKGMCLILGHSGCGKTTLLNVLGGLDTKFQGEYRFLDKKLSTEKDFADFRKEYVGFVFQDFNLIEDLTVSENISIGYKFTQEDCSDKINEVLSRVGLEGYGDRYPSELSGGEQQRVAIARAMLKQCRLLLADEPTGNLDSNNGREIYSLLKEISKEKLVVVVSHDEDLGRQFADYTVSLQGGEVISHDLPTEIHTQEKYVEAKHKAISDKIAFKMARHEIARKKGRAVVNIVLMTLCFLILSFAVGLTQYNEADVNYRLIKSQGYEFFQIQCGTGAELNSYLSDCDYVRGTSISRGISGTPILYFESRQDAESFGITLYESDKNMELAKNVCYISDYMVNEYINNKRWIYIDGIRTQLKPGIHTTEDFIGKTLSVIDGRVCGGIYYSHYDPTTAGDAVAEYRTKWLTGYIEIPSVNFTNKGMDISVRGYNEVSYTNLQVGAKAYISRDNSAIERLDDLYLLLKDTGEIVLYPEGKEVNLNEDLKDGETYLGLEDYNKLFGASYTESDLIDLKIFGDDLECSVSLKEIPSALGNTVDVYVTNSYTRKELSVNDIKVKGLILHAKVYYPYGTSEGESRFDSIETQGRLYLNDVDTIFKCLNFGSNDGAAAWIRTDSVKNLKAFIRNNYKHYDGTAAHDYEINTPFVKDSFNITCDVYIVVWAVIVLGFPLLIAMMLVLNLTVSAQIKDRKRELGIFKALGAQNKDLAKIYVLEMLIMVIPIILFATLGAWLLTLELNFAVVANYSLAYQALYYGWLNVPITVFVVFFFLLLATIVPLAKISRLNVIEAIRNS